MFRKVLLTVAVAAVTMPLMQVHAQQSGSVNVSATVAEHIVLSGNEDLVFPGSLARGQNAAVSATDEAANAKRTLVYNRNVAVSFGVPASLTSAGGDQLPITLYCAHRTGAGSWQGESNECGNGIQLSVGPNTTTTTLGFGALIQGVHIDAARAGAYSGTMTIQVTAQQ